MKTQSTRWRLCLHAQIILTVAVVLLAGALDCRAQGPYPRSDFQVWTSFDAAHPVSQGTDFKLGAELRYGNDQGHLIYRRITSGFAFHWHKFFTLEPYYQYSVGDSISGPLTPENRLALATTVGAPWKHWQVSDRNLGERRFIENAGEWRYRNRVEIRRPVVLARKQLSVFAWDEVYYSSIVRRWYRNRLALGAGRRLSKKISIDVFYVHQNDGYSHPGDLNGLGMTLKTRF